MEYQTSSDTGPLLLGEILSGVWEYRLNSLLAPPEEVSAPEYQAFHHPLVIILCPPCDLESDHRSRFIDPPENEDALKPEVRDSIPMRIAYVRVCDVYEESQIRDAIDPTSARRRFPSDIWKRIRGNQDIRYHRLPQGTLKGEELGPLYLDFKKEFPLPAEPLWKTIQSGHITRLGVVPPDYIYDLFQRYNNFQSRIGQPE